MENYFSFYELEERFDLDGAALKKLFYAYSRKYHPDYTATLSQTEQNESLQKSTLNNQAYRTLSDPFKLLEYLLKLKGVLQSADKEDKMDPMFLMEMMDINERIMDNKMGGDDSQVANIKNDIDTFAKELDAEATVNKELYNNSQDIEHLVALKAYYFKKKYLRRIYQQLENSAPEI